MSMKSFEPFCMYRHWIRDCLTNCFCLAPNAKSTQEWEKYITAEFYYETELLQTHHGKYF